MDKKNILVIEDNEKHRFLLKDILDDEGYRVEIETDENTVRKKISNKSPFDLIMVDIAVPGFDTVQFIKDYMDKYEILVVSAFVEEVKGILPTDRQIKKPFDTDMLLDRIKKILNG